MPNEEEENLTEPTLSTRERALLPLSIAVLKVLRWFEPDSGYFGHIVTDRWSIETRRKIIRFYFYAAISDRFTRYAPILIGILLTLSLDKCGLVGLSLPLQAYGLIFDGVGAVILAVGLFRGPDGILRDTPRQSTGAAFGGETYYNPKPLSATVRNTVDGVFGGGFLVLGFSIQFLAVTGLTPRLVPC